MLKRCLYFMNFVFNGQWQLEAGTSDIFVQQFILVLAIIQFGGNLFRYYLVFVRQIIIIFAIVIVPVIIIVNENITGSDSRVRQ